MLQGDNSSRKFRHFSFGEKVLFELLSKVDFNVDGGVLYPCGERKAKEQSWEDPGTKIRLKLE